MIDGTSNDDTVVATRSAAASRSKRCASSPSWPTSSAPNTAWRPARSSASSRARGPTTCRAACSAFHRDDSFDAQDPFSKAQGSGKAPFSQQRYGGFLGGPLMRDRFHYFGSFERLREKSTSVITSSLVPADEREEPATDMGHQYFVKTDRA